MQIQPYLFFNGRCDEALAFYRAALGGEVTYLIRYKDNPTPAAPGSVPDHWDDKVMHANLTIGQTQLMLSDGNQTTPNFSGFSLFIGLPDAAAVDQSFAALAEGGQVIMPPSATFWSPKFGMLTDRFGVTWMLGVDVPLDAQQAAGA